MPKEAGLEHEQIVAGDVVADHEIGIHRVDVFQQGMDELCFGSHLNRPQPIRFEGLCELERILLDRANPLRNEKRLLRSGTQQEVAGDWFLASVAWSTLTPSYTIAAAE